jgi:transcriptional regulator with XRE-family HTH domain
MAAVAYWRFVPLRLRAARTAKGWSLAELARNASMRPPALAAIETHQRPCRERSARAIAAVLGVPLEDLAAPYTVSDRPKPRQLPVDVSPTKEDFHLLKEACRELVPIMFDVSDRVNRRYEDGAVIMADAAALVHVFADALEGGAQEDLIGFESLLGYHGDQPHYAITTLTPERRTQLVEALESFNIDVGGPSRPPVLRAATTVVADWIRAE